MPSTEVVKNRRRDKCVPSSARLANAAKHRVWPDPQEDGLTALDPAPQEELGPAVQGDTLADERSHRGPPQRPEVGTKPLWTGGSVPQRQRADPQEEMLSTPRTEAKLSTRGSVPQRQRGKPSPQEEMLNDDDPTRARGRRCCQHSSQLHRRRHWRTNGQRGDHPSDQESKATSPH